MKATRSAHTSCIRVARAHSGNRRRPVPVKAPRGLVLRCAPAEPGGGRGIPLPAAGAARVLQHEAVDGVGHRAAWRGHRRL
ncbi:hypothetical protein SGPA1_11597 [Streptomyces misionensis JCM 4497]